MKRQLNPVVVWAVIGVIVLAIGALGFKTFVAGASAGPPVVPKPYKKPAGYAPGGPIGAPAQGGAAGSTTGK
jgi:hypothetical protein